MRIHFQQAVCSAAAVISGGSSMLRLFSHHPSETFFTERFYSKATFEKLEQVLFAIHGLRQREYITTANIPSTKKTTPGEARLVDP